MAHEGAAPPRIVRTEADEKQTDDEIRIVLFGMTGCGKSTTGNTILGPEFPDKFEESIGPNATESRTRECQRRSIKINGRNIRVIDTPGLLDAVPRDQDEVKSELTRCLLMSCPGPHIFLFVLNLNARFTDQEFMAYDMLRKLFESHLHRYVAVAFTHGDELTTNGEKPEDLLKNVDEIGERNPSGQRTLKRILNDVGGKKRLLFSNKGTQATKDEEVLELLRLISIMKEDNSPNPFFIDQKTQAAARYMETLVEEYRRNNPGTSRKDAWAAVQWRVKLQTIGVAGVGFVGGAAGGVAAGIGAASLLALPAILTPVGAGIVGAVLIGSAAAGTYRVVRSRCSVM